jgi:hypothetical protein
VITACRYGDSVGPFEAPAIPVVSFDAKTTFMHESVMLRAQQHQVIQTCFAAGRPVLNVMGINETLVSAAREYASFVSGPKGAFNGGGDRTSFATDIQRFTILVVNDYNRVAVATKALH